MRLSSGGPRILATDASKQEATFTHEVAKPLGSIGPRNWIVWQCVALKVLRHLWLGMGHVEVEVTIATTDGIEGIEVKALVDTGSTFTVLPASLAKTLCLKPSMEKVRVSTAKGCQDLPLAHAMVRIVGKERILPV